MRSRAAKSHHDVASDAFASTHRRPPRPGRLELIKYDPIVNQRVLFKEERIKK